MERTKRVIAALALVAAAGSAPVRADGETTECDTEFALHVAAFGPVQQDPETGQYCRNVTYELVTTTTCTTTVCDIVCDIVQQIVVFHIPPSTTVIVVTNGITYHREIISQTTTVDHTSIFFTLKKRWACVPDPPMDTVNEWTVSDEDVLRHSVPGAVLGTFDGMLLSPGQEISLLDYGPGTYTYYLETTDGTNTFSHEYTVHVEASHSLRQVDAPPSGEVLPTALFEFTNETNQAVLLHLEAAATSTSLEAQVTDNLLTVAPQQTVQRSVSFTTVPGNGIPEGANFSAIVSAYANGSLVATQEVLAASSATTRGSGEDVRMRSEVDDGGLPSLCAKTASVGDTYSVTIDSPGGTFDGKLAILYYDTFTLGNPIQRLSAGIPFHLSANYKVATSAVLAPGGVTHTDVVPLGLSGLVLRTQALALSPDATNGAYALSDAFDLRVE